MVVVVAYPEKIGVATDEILMITGGMVEEGVAEESLMVGEEILMEDGESLMVEERSLKVGERSLKDGERNLKVGEGSLKDGGDLDEDDQTIDGNVLLMLRMKVTFHPWELFETDLSIFFPIPNFFSLN